MGSRALGLPVGFGLEVRSSSPVLEAGANCTDGRLPSLAPANASFGLNGMVFGSAFSTARVSWLTGESDDG